MTVMLHVYYVSGITIYNNCFVCKRHTYQVIHEAETLHILYVQAMYKGKRQVGYIWWAISLLCVTQKTIKKGKEKKTIIFFLSPI